MSFSSSIRTGKNPLADSMDITLKYILMSVHILPLILTVFSVFCACSDVMGKFTDTNSGNSEYVPLFKGAKPEADCDIQ